MTEEIKSGIIVDKGVEEIDRNARAYGWEVGQGRVMRYEMDFSSGNPFMDPHWRSRISEADIVVIHQGEDFEETMRRVFTDFKYDLAIQNKPESVRFLEGRKIDKVYYTPDVMLAGMDEGLLSVIENSFVRSGTPRANLQMLP